MKPSIEERATAEASHSQPAPAANPSGSNSSTTSSAPINRSKREMTLLVVLLLVAITTGLYLPTLHNGFINFDDPPYITENGIVQRGLTLRSVEWAFKSTNEANWLPMTWISLMGTRQFLGPKPAGFHFTNMLLHGFDVVMLFLLLRLATGYLARSAIVAALFAVFPMNVEAVAWAVERKSVQSMAFLMLALLCYGWYVRRPGVARYLAIMVFFALGLMTKAWIVSVPFALLLLDYWPLNRIGVPAAAAWDAGEWWRTFWKLAVEKAPLMAMSFASIGASIYAADVGGALTGYSAKAPLGLRLENAEWSYVAYLLKGVWPHPLAIIYPFPEQLLPLWKVGLAAVVLVGITVLVWRSRERRYLLTGWLWYLGILFPLIGIIQTGAQSMADRWAYVSFLGLFVAAVWAVAESRRISRAAIMTLAVLAICGYAWVAHVQIGYWKDSYTLFSHALDVTQRNGYAELNLAGALEHDYGRPDLALPHYQAAVEYAPDSPTAHYDLGVLLAGQGRLANAMQEYREAVADSWTKTQAAMAHNNLGTLLLSENKPQDAMREFSAAIEDDPTFDYALLNRAMIEYQANRFDAARQDFLRAVQMVPTAGTYYWLGRALEAKGDAGTAVEAYEAALRMNPNWTDAELRVNALRGTAQK